MMKTANMETIKLTLPVILVFSAFTLCQGTYSKESEIPPPLGKYGADSSNVSLSGFSSGAFMAVQVHVAYSKSLMGVGVIAGGPYYCAQANSSVITCMQEPRKINVKYLAEVTRRTVSTGTIDDTANMEGDRIYLFGGILDATVKQGVVQKVEEYYRYFVTTPTFMTNYSMMAGHAMITNFFGNPCDVEQSPYINNCNYHQAFAILNHIYGDLKKPTGEVPLYGIFLTFDQSEFLPGRNPKLYSMDNIGYAYIPSACRSTSSNCKVHVVLHGCTQGRIFLKEIYARKTGYNEVAELNDIIIIYPQITPTLVNINGCWDWWGYTGLAYATNLAPQMSAIKQMIDRVLS
ncbi:poly(3-hydroxybutyrate) depolymerase-like [Amphiura filiformis]|uniref:poly(3-hydroxybutyrate) depolymerase-like n=1 Tax=Amphiura filiformis TaxID=82378 RepID=UPI003B218A7B